MHSSTIILSLFCFLFLSLSFSETQADQTTRDLEKDSAFSTEKFELSPFQSFTISNSCRTTLNNVNSTTTNTAYDSYLSKLYECWHQEPISATDWSDCNNNTNVVNDLATLRLNCNQNGGETCNITLQATFNSNNLKTIFYVCIPVHNCTDDINEIIGDYGVQVVNRLESVEFNVTDPQLTLLSCPSGQKPSNKLKPWIIVLIVLLVLGIVGVAATVAFVIFKKKKSTQYI